MIRSIVQSFAQNSRRPAAKSLLETKAMAARPHAINLTATGLPIHLYRRTRDIRVGTEDAAVAVSWLQHPTAAQAVVEIQAGVGRHGLGRLMAAMRTDQRGPQFHLHGHRPAASRGRAQGSMKGCQAKDSSTRTVATTRRPAATRDGRRQDASRLHMRRRRQCSTHPAIRTTIARPVSQPRIPAIRAAPAKDRPASERANGRTQQAAQAKTDAAAPTAAVALTAISGRPARRVSGKSTVSPRSIDR